jgi:hypothetical protein
MTCPTCRLPISPSFGSCLNPRCARVGADRIGVPPPSEVRRLHSLSDMSIGLAFIATVGALVASVATFVLLSELGDSLGDSATGILIVIARLSLGVALVVYPAGITFLVWLYRARRNLDAMPEVRAAWRSGWSVGVWFIPLANIVLVGAVTADVARNSDPAHARHMSRLVWSWWVTLLLAQIALGVASLFTQNPAALTMALLLEVAGAVLLVAALLLFSTLVLRVSRAQAQRLGLA